MISINHKIKPFKKTIEIEGDKSLSIRWALLASQALGKSVAYNLLKSEDVMSTLNCLRKLGVKVKISNNKCEISGVGLNGFKYKKNLILNCGNSGTLGRLILGLLINTTNKIELRGDKSLSKRDFSRVTAPLKKFGAKFNKKKNLPLIMQGLTNPRPINYLEKKGSAQCKTTVMLAVLKSNGFT